MRTWGRRGLIAALASTVMVISPAVTMAHVPTNTACYYGGTVSHTASFYRYYESSSIYSKITSRVDYQIGYTCTGERILVRVTYRKATFQATYASPSQWHTVRNSAIVYDNYSGTHFTLNNFSSAYASCYGACTVSLPISTVVLVEYQSTTNTHTFVVVNSTPLGENGDFPIYHCFVRNVIGYLSNCG